MSRESSCLLPTPLSQVCLFSFYNPTGCSLARNSLPLRKRAEKEGSFDYAAKTAAPLRTCSAQTPRRLGAAEAGH